jgi:hypothetical protein
MSIAAADLKFKTWNHPTSGQVRVYVDGLPNKGDSKVWVQATPDGAAYEVRARLAEGIVSDTLEAELKAATQEALDGVNAKTFEDVVALTV